MKLKYKKEIKELKERYPNIKNKELLEKLVGKELKSKKRTITILNVTITVSFLVSLIAILLIGTLILNFTSIMSSVAGNTISTLFDDKKDKDEEGEEEGWSWEKKKGSGVEGSGGIYPKDPKLKNRAQLLEVIEKACKDAESVYGNYVHPAWILGSIYRENGNSLYGIIDNSNNTEILKDLIVQIPPCGKGNGCSWTNNGQSHYYGGSVSGGTDNGDPYKQVIDTSSSNYYAYGEDHAIGILQFEIPYLYGHLTRMYGNPEPVLSGDLQDPENLQSQVKMDDDLGFIRPNPQYIPDLIYNTAFYFACPPTNSGSDYDNIINSSEFTSLSKHNQDFIKFMYASAAYGMGHINSTTDEMARALIRVAQSGAVENLDEMVLGNTDQYWNADAIQPQGSWGTFVYDVNSRLGINVNTTYSSSYGELPYVYWYGVYSANVGKVAYNQMKALIDAAEKEESATGGQATGTSGNWVGKPGSGRFGNDNSPYYIESVGVRWYNQTSQVNQYSSTWGGLTLLPDTTMAEAGCGIYTLAMVASNLYNKDITPDVALAALEGQYQVGCLNDAGVVYLASKLGLQTKLVNFYDPNITNIIYDILDRGNMIVFVSQAYNPTEFPWYYGDGHFMAVRGKTDDGKLLGISSVGNYRAGLSGEGMMSTPISPEVFIKYLSRNRNYFWEVGINVE